MSDSPPGMQRPPGRYVQSMPSRAPWPSKRAGIAERACEHRAAGVERDRQLVRGRFPLAAPVVELPTLRRLQGARRAARTAHRRAPRRSVGASSQTISSSGSKVNVAAAAALHPGLAHKRATMRTVAPPTCQFVASGWRVPLGQQCEAALMRDRLEGAGAGLVGEPRRRRSTRSRSRSTRTSRSRPTVPSPRPRRTRRCARSGMRAGRARSRCGATFPVGEVSASPAPRASPVSSPRPYSESDRCASRAARCFRPRPRSRGTPTTWRPRCSAGSSRSQAGARCACRSVVSSPSWSGSRIAKPPPRVPGGLFPIRSRSTMRRSTSVARRCSSRPWPPETPTRCVPRPRTDCTRTAGCPARPRRGSRWTPHCGRAPSGRGCQARDRRRPRSPTPLAAKEIADAMPKGGRAIVLEIADEGATVTSRPTQ